MIKDYNLEFVLVDPDLVIGMNDYPPLHSPEDLKKYYDCFRSKNAVQVIPVIPVNLVLAYFRNDAERFAKYEHKWREFVTAHPQIGYFMVDGKHRASAATLAGEKLPCVIIKSDDDTKELLRLKESGKFERLTGVKETITETMEILEHHFFAHKRFWTVREKTQAMISNGDVPEYMLPKK